MAAAAAAVGAARVLRVSLPERANWRDEAKELGFGFHEMYGEPYWTDGAAYLFSLEAIERDIEEPSGELHEMCMGLAAEVVESRELMTRLAIPEEHHDLVRYSWIEGDRHLYGRFDFAYRGDGPAKLLEYNADTPTSIFESAFFQHGWLLGQIENGWLPGDADQYNFLQETLVEAFASFDRGPILHFACAMDNDEDRGTTTYLMDCAMQADHRTEMLDVREIGVDADGRFTDKQDRVIDRCFKLYPWEDMLRETFAPHLRPGVFIEPPWKAILSNKAILPLLWERHEGHPNLLPAYFADDPRADELANAVSKPFHSREGENVVIRLEGEATEASDGDYAESPRVVQAYEPLLETDDAHAVVGSWVIGDRPCGLGMREDASRITRNLSRFVPHAIVADPQAVKDTLDAERQES